MEGEKVEKERKVKTLSLVALIVAVLGLTVAFAALSQTLTINGTASVDAAQWDIHFENLSEPVIEGGAQATTPTLSDTSVTGYDVTVTKPGDSVTYEFDIVNNGTVDAVIEKINMASKYNTCLNQSSVSVECKPFDFNGDGYINASDTSMYLSLINYGLYYTDTEKKVSRNDTLIAGETKHVKLVIEYKYSSNMLPESDFVIVDENTPLTIKYVQAD